MTNSLTVSTTGYWPRIYFFQYRAVVTGWQLTANRISVAGAFARLTSTRWCGSHPTRCTMQFAVCGLQYAVCCIGFAKNKQGSVSDIVLTIICTWRISLMVSMIPQLSKHFRGQVFHTLFYFRLPSNIAVFSDIYLDQAHVLKSSG